MISFMTEVGKFALKCLIVFVFATIFFSEMKFNVTGSLVDNSTIYVR